MNNNSNFFFLGNIFQLASLLELNEKTKVIFDIILSFWRNTFSKMFNEFTV